MVKSMGSDVLFDLTQLTVEYESTSQGLLRPKSMYYERYDTTLLERIALQNKIAEYFDFNIRFSKRDDKNRAIIYLN